MQYMHDTVSNGRQHNPHRGRKAQPHKNPVKGIKQLAIIGFRHLHNAQTAHHKGRIQDGIVEVFSAPDKMAYHPYGQGSKNYEQGQEKMMQQTIDEVLPGEELLAFMLIKHCISLAWMTNTMG